MTNLKKIITTLVGSLILLSLLLISSCANKIPSAKNVTLPSIFSNHMVIQRDSKITVWGNADSASGVVAVKFNGQEEFADVSKEGKWSLQLKPISAGGPFNLEVISKDTIIYKDVLIGDVWLCSGQSNMEMSVVQSLNATEEIKNANYKRIRLITVPREASGEPLDDFPGSWAVCSSDVIENFTAVGYFFGRKLYEELNIPIGLIHSSWGGTPIESWMNYSTLQNDTNFLPIISRYEEDMKDYPSRLKEYEEIVKRIQSNKTIRPMFQVDEGNKGVAKGYGKKEFNDKDWKEMNLPQLWEEQKDMEIDGAVWFRKTIMIPEDWVDSDLVVELGAIDDFDETYFNGRKIGATGIDIPSFWTHKRKYNVDKQFVRKGKAVIAIRVFDHFAGGGFKGPKRLMKIYQKEISKNAIDLAGKWKFKIEKALDPNDITGPSGNGLPTPPIGPKHPQSPSTLYNGMLNPIAKFPIKGAIWYQGESNVERAYQYRTLLPNMFKDWRTLWNNPQLFVGVVQISNYSEVNLEPTESDWAELREAQTFSVADDKYSSLALAIDIGDADDIHPKNKQDVGKRLALGALAKVYNKNIVYSGPVYKSHLINKNKIAISFSHIGTGLKIKEGNKLEGFSIASDDQDFVWANAKIENDKVIVWSDKITKPVSVRYAWANNPKCNLYNEDGLPAVPFRLDKWEGVTFGKK